MTHGSNARALTLTIPLVTLIAAFLGAGPRQPGALDLPPIVFVSRRPIPGGVPGVGPRDRAAIPGGRLLVRRANGRVGTLGPGNRFFDVSDPAVSYDGRTVAFAAITRPDSAWRIWRVDADGRNLRPITRTGRGLDEATLGAASPLFRRYDDLDPVWLPDGRICFASTRYPQIAEAGVPATNVFVVDADGSNLIRITAERNGGEEPTVDPVTGRLVYARWWTSRFLASNLDSSGVTEDVRRALPGERRSLWHAISILPDGEGMKLAGGFPRRRDQTMAYQPLVLDDGTLVGVTADTLALVPRPGRLSLEIFPGGFAEPVQVPAAPGSMCSPAALPDGRLLVSCDPTGAGDFGLYRMARDGSELERVLDIPHWLELDAAVLVPRPVPPVLAVERSGLRRPLPAHDGIDLKGGIMRFDCLNVFANGPVDFPIPDAPPPKRTARIRFFAALSQPHARAGDSAVFVHEGLVDRSGAVHEVLTPADLPMFEQLVDERGRVIQAVSGPAHVPGFNFGRMGAMCVGCHVGHSAIPVPLTWALGKRFNAAPSARVTASSVADGSTAAALVERRTRGPTRDVAWIARGTGAERARLAWDFPLAIDSLVVYGIRSDSAAGTDLTVHGIAWTLFRSGRVVGRGHESRTIDPNGTAFDCRGIRADSLEIQILESTGRVGGIPRTGLAEVEARVRIPEDQPGAPPARARGPVPQRTSSIFREAVKSPATRR